MASCLPAFDAWRVAEQELLAVRLKRRVALRYQGEGPPAERHFAALIDALELNVQELFERAMNELHAPTGTLPPRFLQNPPAPAAPEMDPDQDDTPGEVR